MNSKTTATIAIWILLAIAFVIYERNRAREIHTALAALNNDRESLNRRVKELTDMVIEARDREAAWAKVAAAPQVESRPSPPQPERIDYQPPPGVTLKAPAGWSLNGSKIKSYVGGVDRVQTWAGQPSAFVKSVESNIDGFGGMMQMASAEQFVGKRVRLSGWAKTEDANDGGGHLWFRVDGQQPGRSLQFDNMDNRPIKGTTNWQQYSVVLDVPKDASALAYGFFVQGTGQMWLSGAKMEEVGSDVPTTNLIKPPRALPKTPTNLNFDPGP